MSAHQGFTVPAMTRYVTDDVQEVREWLDRIYGSRLLMGSISDGAARLAVSVADAGSFRTTDLAIPGVFTCRNQNIDTVRVGVVVSGTATIDDGDAVNRYGPGDALMATFPGTTSSRAPRTCASGPWPCRSTCWPTSPAPLRTAPPCRRGCCRARPSAPPPPGWSPTPSPSPTSC
ncbi:hypothetical protein ACFQ0B_50850 [Nonomuraea thailandensis]